MNNTYHILSLIELQVLCDILLHLEDSPPANRFIFSVLDPEVYSLLTTIITEHFSPFPVQFNH